MSLEDSFFAYELILLQPKLIVVVQQKTKCQHYQSPTFISLHIRDQIPWSRNIG